MWAILLTFLAVISAIFTIIAFVGFVLDLIRSRAIRRAEVFPVNIHRSIRFGDYVAALRRYEQLLKQDRDHPDVVVGIHYGGIASAADVARRFYGTLRRIEVKFVRADGATTCTDVLPRFDPSEVKGKNVLLVDNRIRSGLTMRMAKERIESYGAANVRTLVIFKPANATGRADDVLFYGKRDLKHLLR